MEPYFKKYFWTFRVAAIVALGLLLSGTSSAIGARFLAPFTVAVPKTAVGDKGSAKPAPKSTRPEISNVLPEPPPVVLEDKCTEVACEPGELCNPESGACEPDPAADASVPGGPCKESTIALALVGTIVAADPQWSLAVLHNPGTNKTQFATIGTNLLAEADVVRIERSRVFLSRQGKEECLRPGDPSARAAKAQGAGGLKAAMGSMGKGGAGEEAPTVVSKPGGAGGSIESRIQTGVTSTGPNSYNVDRNLIREVASDQKSLKENAPRIVPYFEGGAAKGFRLQGLKSGGMFSAIGIRNGDVVLSVNGSPIDSPQKALDIYQSMMTQSSVNLTVLRRGKEEQLTYAIQ
jgi:general secretion pathway protein C